jgi:hypothetical protein
MEFSSKDYKTSKTKQYIKTTKLFFFFTGIDRNSNDWILTEQNLNNLKFNYYKVFNKTASQTLQNSIYNNVKPVINGITFLIKPASSSGVVSKQMLVNNFEPLLFIMLAIKLNNKIYSTKRLKNVSSLEYSENKLLLYQFGLTNLKFYFKS